MKKQFVVPGIFHPLTVRIVPDRTLNRNEKKSKVLGDYSHRDGDIRLVHSQTPHVMGHTLFHEFSHHILDTLKGMKNEEDKCDVLATYLIKLSEAYPNIKKQIK